MAQCEKILDNGEQCSNRAAPGTRYCQSHGRGRIVFTRVDKTAEAPSPPSAPVQVPPSAPRPTQQNWQATPSATGQTPTFPALHPDEQRNVLVAPEGFIWLQTDATDQPSDAFNRLVKLMSFLSQKMILPNQVKLFLHKPDQTYLIYLTPADTTQNLPFFYDNAADAAKLVQVQLYIGKSHAFVQYRDESAPRGYEVPGFQVPSDTNELLLIADGGTQRFLYTNCTEIALSDFCMQIAPLPDTTDEPLELAYALVPHALYALLARYFHAHHLRYRIARLRTSQAELMLFEIGPRENAPIGQRVPRFILDHLSRLPGVALLRSAYEVGEVTMLVHWHYRYPLHLAHVADAFMPNEMILFSTDPYTNMRIDPAPTFFEGDQLVDAKAPGFTPINQTQPLGDTPATLKVEILLRPDDGPIPPIAALILNTQEMALLRYLLYRLPGDAFNALSYAPGQEFSLLLGNGRAIEGVPFGTPLRRPGDRELFIPLRSRLIPDLPWPLLHEALALHDHTYTFLLADSRLDVPESAFVPLARSLVAGSQRAQMHFNRFDPDSLSVLHWTPPEPPPAEKEADKPRNSSLFGLGNRREQTASSKKTPKNSGQETPASWREQAQTCEEAGDFLGAAVCYKFAKDMTSSARCYRQATQVLRTQKRKEE